MLSLVSRRRTRVMQQQDLQNLKQVLRTMGELELTVAEFYQTCSECWTEHVHFWMDMEYAEIKHADNIERMREILSERPENFQIGRFIPATEMKAFISGVKSNIQRLKGQEIDERKVLSLSVALEQSILESNYAEVVKTDDTEFRSLMREINADTVFHREYLNHKIEEWTA
jgi:hypothetical protein